MVIDGGPKAASGMVYSYIRDTLKITHIDFLVSTHPTWIMYTACLLC